MNTRLHFEQQLNTKTTSHPENFYMSLKTMNTKLNFEHQLNIKTTSHQENFNKMLQFEYQLISKLTVMQIERKTLNQALH